MKRIIEGKRYNTDTAQKIASYDNGCGGGDFDCLEETLYHTKAGALFIHGRGGARTWYASSSEGGRCFSSGEDIIPYTKAETKEWLELHHKEEAIERLWPDEIVDA